MTEPSSPDQPTPIGLVLEVDPELRKTLAQRAGGRVLVIDAFRSWQCGTWIGDVTVEWWASAPGPDFAVVDAVEGVPVFVHRRLVRILAAARPRLRRGLLPFFGTVALELERPELWIDYLDRPGAWQP